MTYEMMLQVKGAAVLAEAALMGAKAEYGVIANSRVWMDGLRAAQAKCVAAGNAWAQANAIARKAEEEYRRESGLLAEEVAQFCATGEPPAYRLFIDD